MLEQSGNKNRKSAEHCETLKLTSNELVNRNTKLHFTERRCYIYGENSKITVLYFYQSYLSHCKHTLVSNA